METLAELFGGETLSAWFWRGCCCLARFCFGVGVLVLPHWRRQRMRQLSLMQPQTWCLLR